MGWTKHADAILAHRKALNSVSAELRSLVGKLGDKGNCQKAIALLRDHERLSSALAYGNRDGALRAEVGVTSGQKDKNLSPLLEELILRGPTQLTFRRQKNKGAEHGQISLGTKTSGSRLDKH